MNRLGLQSLDELEAARRAESEAVIEVQSHGGVDVVDWNAMFGDAWGSRLSQTEEQAIWESSLDLTIRKVAVVRWSISTSCIIGYGNYSNVTDALGRPGFKSL
ncbi:hypothetical protein LZ30DRAFT_695168 [Colletotrichum cereale]|nr:hypothetical protein LZ30DRAFT_695168 [Colletotrichum cereale]